MPFGIRRFPPRPRRSAPKARLRAAQRLPRRLLSLPHSRARLLSTGICYSDQIGRILKSDYSGRSFRRVFTCAFRESGS